jgi:hypothetical protein
MEIGRSDATSGDITELRLGERHRILVGDWHEDELLGVIQ